MRQLNDNIVTVQAAASVNSAAIPSENLLYISAQLAATGSAAGTMKLQASNDNTNGEDNTVPTNWSDIPSATVSVSGAGAFLIPITNLCYQYVRVVYTNSGTGTISIVIKAIGA
jgi:hypothetical protein